MRSLRGLFVRIPKKPFLLRRYVLTRQSFEILFREDVKRNGDIVCFLQIKSVSFGPNIWRIGADCVLSRHSFCIGAKNPTAVSVLGPRSLDLQNPSPPIDLVGLKG